MKQLRIVGILAGAAAVALACRNDPTSSLRGGPKFIDMSANQLFMSAGDARAFQVVVRDEQLNPLDASVTVTSNAPSVATVAADTTTPSANGTLHNFVISAIAADTAYIVVTSGGLRDSAQVIVQ